MFVNGIELMETNATLEEIHPHLMFNSQFSTPIEQMVTEEELRMLGLNPEELLRTLNRRSSYVDEYNYLDVLDSIDEDDYDDDVNDNDYEDVDDDDDDINPGFIINRNHFARVFRPQSSALDVENNSDNQISNQLPSLIANYLHSINDSSTDDDDREVRHNVDHENSSSSDENCFMHSDSSSENIPSIDSISSMEESDESCHHFVSYSESNDESISSYSSTDLSRSSNYSSPNSLSDTEDPNSYSSISDSSSSY